MLIYINACVRTESRTRVIADALVSKYSEPVMEVVLEKIDFPKVDDVFIRRRDDLKAGGDYSDPIFDLARQFAEADRIVIAAPFWDLSFPASLKQYFEMINVGGVTFTYTDEGTIRGLCRAEELIYVTTAGGDFCPEEYGFGYVKALARNFYGIQDVRLVKATGLDIVGADADRIVEDTVAGL